MTQRGAMPAARGEAARRLALARGETRQTLVALGGGVALAAVVVPMAVLLGPRDGADRAGHAPAGRDAPVLAVSSVAESGPVEAPPATAVQGESYLMGLRVARGTLPGGAAGLRLGPASGAMFRSVDFGRDPAHGLVLHLASLLPAGGEALVQVRLDDAAGPPVGAVRVTAPDVPGEVQDVAGSLDGVSGRHDVYLTVEAPGVTGDVAVLDWFTARAG